MVVAGALLTVLAALTTAGCGRAPVAEVGVSRIAPDAREAMPPIYGTTLAGDALRIPTASTVTVLNNWASWCEPCRAEVPVLVDAASKSRAGVQFVGLNVSDEQKAAEDFVKQTHMSYPSIVDSDGALLATIPGVPAKSLPSTVFIDRQGRIAARVIGEVSSTDLRSIIDELVAEPA